MSHQKPAPLRIAFVLDQQVGLRTQAMYLESFVAEDEEIKPIWVPVRYEAPAGLWERVPRLPHSIRGTMRGVGEIRAGFARAGNDWDAALWATWAAKSVPDLVRARPSFLRMDMTPTQMEAMGAEYGYTKQRARFLAGWKRRATVRLHEGISHFFPWNEWVAQSLREDWQVGAETVTPISPGVDTRLYRPARETEKANDGVTRILFVGGNFARKGGDDLLRWAANEGRTLRERGFYWELHIVTRDAPPAESLPPAVAEHLHFYAQIANNSPELVRLYQKCDIFVLPTRADCYSLVALEAMACGLPVIITGLGGIPDIVTPDVGLLLDTDETRRTEQLPAFLEQLITQPEARRTMGALARARAVERFDAGAGVRKMMDTMKTYVREQARERVRQFNV